MKRLRPLILSMAIGAMPLAALAPAFAAADQTGVPAQTPATSFPAVTLPPAAQAPPPRPTGGTLATAPTPTQRRTLGAAVLGFLALWALAIWRWTRLWA